MGEQNRPLRPDQLPPCPYGEWAHPDVNMVIAAGSALRTRRPRPEPPVCPCCNREHCRCGGLGIQWWDFIVLVPCRCPAGVDLQRRLDAGLLDDTDDIAREDV